MTYSRQCIYKENCKNSSSFKTLISIHKCAYTVQTSLCFWISKALLLAGTTTDIFTWDLSLAVQGTTAGKCLGGICVLEQAASGWAFQQIVAKFCFVTRISPVLPSVQHSLQSQSNDELSLSWYRTPLNSFSPQKKKKKINSVLCRKIHIS